ncbi:MAG: methylated-DNA--[protein]-cysteine S-methyltransferase [Deltaproteobacteria bacterium]|nr:methylated-DNA--[protein]-cysteine S-methyltransferase [Deltaproteobacteria bacterium]
MPLQTAVLPSPVGLLALDCDGSALTAVHLRVSGPPREPSGPVLQRAARELEEYFAGRRRTFSVPLRRPPSATAFQHLVWDELLRIPFGETRTYGELARALGTAARAVGGACGRNALPLFIPCHRVVAKAGLGGFSGDWESGLALDVKRVLLEHEACACGST